LPKPQRDGTTALTLTPLELINQLAARLVHGLAAARAASPSLSRRARAQRAAACGCHRLHTWGGERNRRIDRGQFATADAGLQDALPGHALDVVGWTSYPLDSRRLLRGWTTMIRAAAASMRIG
jgi:hypothetical protein